MKENPFIHNLMHRAFMQYGRVLQSEYFADHYGKLSRWLDLDRQKEGLSFNHPWAIGCGCLAY